VDLCEHESSLGEVEQKVNSSIRMGSRIDGIGSTVGTHGRVPLRRDEIGVG
jgi:hypothetical protein